MDRTDRERAIWGAAGRNGPVGMYPRTPAVCLTAWLVFAMLLVLPVGCFPRPEVGFDSPAPSKRLDAIVEASRMEDDESLIKLVEKLRSLVPTERMFAIRSLEVRTGETLGYDHAVPHWKRIDAYNRWLAWLRDQGLTLPESMQPIATPEREAEDGSP